MGSTYPITLDSLQTSFADASAMKGLHAQHHDDLADAVNKIQAELGIKPRTGSPNLWTFSRTPGRSMEIGGSLDAAVSPSGPELIKVHIAPTVFANGTNALRGDSITIDNANGSGVFSSMAGVQVDTATAGGYKEKGTFIGHSFVGSDEQPAGGGNAYNEVIGYFATLVCNRKGALNEAAELGVTVNVAARAQAVTAEVADNTLRSQYTTDLGAGSLWARTGARGLWVLSNGSQAATGIFLQGTMNPAIDYAPSGAGSAILQEIVQGEANARVALFDSGLFFGPGSSGFDATLTRVGGGIMALNGSLQVAQFTPGAAPASTARILVKDNGSGKKQLAVQFPTGSPIVLATEL